MNVSSTTRRLIKAVARRTPPSARRIVPPALHRRAKKWITPKRSSKKSAPVLTVIVPVYNVAAYLEACLESVVSQSLKNLEIIVVDDGSTDECPQIIADYAARDPRIRAMRQENAGQGPARNLAVRHARGEFLAFLDADDIIPPDAYRQMVHSLRKTGSDFSVGAAVRVMNGRQSAPIWNATVHDRDRLKITIDDFPPALQDVIACNRMFRRRFWIDQVGDYRGGVAYEDHVPMVAAYVRATSFDLLAKTTYHWRIREDMTSTGQQKASLSNLRDRIDVKDEAFTIMKQEASEKVRAAWVGRVLDTDFPPYIDHALVADDQYRATLQAALHHYWSIADQDALSHVRLQQKVRGYLASRGAWHEIEAVSRYFREGGAPATIAVSGTEVLVSEEVSELVEGGLPDKVRELAALETALRSCLDHAEWIGPNLLRLSGWSYIKNVDFTESPQTELWLTDPKTGDRIDLEVEHLIKPEATRWSGQRQATCDLTGFRVVIDVSRLAPAETAERHWQLQLRVRVRDVARTGSLHHAISGSSAAPASLRSRTINETGLQAVPRFDPAAGLVVTIRRPSITLEEPGFRRNGRTLVGGVRAADPTAFVPHTIRATERTRRLVVESPITTDATGTHRFAVDLPAVSEEDGSVAGSEWELRVISDRGSSRLLEWAPNVPEPTLVPSSGTALWQRSPRGYARAVLDRPRLLVRDVQATDQEIRIVVDASGLSEAERGAVTLANAKQDVSLLGHETDAEGHLVWRFPTTTSEFGLPSRPLPRGGFWLNLTSDLGELHQVRVAPELKQRFGFDLQTALHRVRFTATGSDQLRIHLDAPLQPDERGNWAQTRLKEYYHNLEPVPEDAVFFQCYRGETATDSQLALHNALHARGGLTLYWGVTDYSTMVPEGAVPLLMGSRVWYEKLASSRYLSNNIDFDGFFRKRPHQRYLQTFHGYPFKSMGKTFWQGKGLSDDRIAMECERRNADWDAILVPSEFCADFYRQEYDYTGEILVTGYPRSDVLVRDGREEIASRIRKGMGIADDQVVVLYAPTYRDQLTTRTYAARRFDELDLDWLTEQLGEGYVILVRGHNNNQREQDRVRGRAQIIDVTDYPEINDLTLAADVAVLDYSSLRFDWALTEKPVLFFVPDLESYFALRPPLFDYLPTASGPLLSTTEEVLNHLRDLDSVTAEYGEVLKQFNRDYNALQDGHATDRVIEAFFSE